MAIVAAETEDQAEDAIAALEVEYDVLPFASQPSAGHGSEPAGPEHSRERERRQDGCTTGATWRRLIAQSDVVKEFTYFFNERNPHSISANRQRGQVGWRQADDVGHGSSRRIRCETRSPGRWEFRRECSLHQQVERRNVWRSDAASAPKFYPWIAYISKQTNRPVKMMLNKDEELAHLAVKAQTLCKFKVGATKDGKILACRREFHVNTGANPGGRFRRRRQEAGGLSCTSTSFRTGRRNGFLYRTNSLNTWPVAEQLPAGVQVGLGTDDG